MFRSDASCFPPYADKSWEKPSHCFCGQESVGAEFLAFLGSNPMIATVKLYCEDHKSRPMAVNVKTLSQGWVVISDDGLGVLKIRKMGKKEKNA